jgi:hypothetical protein
MDTTAYSVDTTAPFQGSSAFSAGAWALHELGFADFNDERLTRRSVDISSRFLQHPQKSIPQSGESWAETKAVYRFFANKKVQSKDMLKAHHRQVCIRAASLPLVLIAQDTVTLNLSGRAITGVGSIGGGTSKGLFVHTGLAIDPNGGIPIGVVTQITYARDEKTKTPEYKKKASKLPVTEKESGRWVTTITEGKKVFEQKQLVFIGDRESDIYEVFAEAQKQGVSVLIRTKQNRILESIGETGEKERLFTKVLTGEKIVTFEADVPIDHHNTRKATLTIRINQINLLPTKRQEGQESIPVTVLNVMEENPPEGISDPIHWMLTTSLPVTTPEEAIEKVTWYIYRWRIERFHYTLKTGAFNIEKLQFETFERFQKAITMYSIVASRVIYTQYYEKEHPEEDAEEIFSPEEITVLCLKAKQRPRKMTVHEAVVATARLGGFLARKNDGPPGIKSLWIGFQALQYLVEGMLLGKEAEIK